MKGAIKMNGRLSLFAVQRVPRATFLKVVIGYIKMLGAKLNNACCLCVTLPSHVLLENALQKQAKHNISLESDDYNLLSWAVYSSKD